MQILKYQKTCDTNKLSTLLVYNKAIAVRLCGAYLGEPDASGSPFRPKLKGIVLDFSILSDLEYIESMKLCAGDHIFIEGWSEKTRSSVKYEILRSNALKTGLLKEIRDNQDNQQ